MEEQPFAPGAGSPGSAERQSGAHNTTTLALHDGGSFSEASVSLQLRHDDSEGTLTPSRSNSFAEGGINRLPQPPQHPPLAFGLPYSTPTLTTLDLQAKPALPQEHRKSLTSTTTVQTNTTTSSYNGNAALMKTNIMQRRNVYISGLPATFRSQDLRDLCKPFGLIEACKLCVSRNNVASSKSYGFVLFCTEESAAACIRAKNGTFLQGRCLQARYADAAATPQPLSDAQKAMLPPPFSRPAQRMGDVVQADRLAVHNPMAMQLAPPPPPAGATTAGMGPMLTSPTSLPGSPTMPMLAQQSPMMVVFGTPPGVDQESARAYSIINTTAATGRVATTTAPMLRTPSQASLLPSRCPPDMATSVNTTPAWVTQTPTWVCYMASPPHMSGEMPSPANPAFIAAPSQFAASGAMPTVGGTPMLAHPYLAASHGGSPQECVILPTLANGAGMPAVPTAVYVPDSANGVPYTMFNA